MSRTTRWARLRTGLSVPWLLAILAFPAFSQTQSATDEEPQELRSPLVVVNVASVERMLTDVDWTFAAAGRPELSDYVVGLMAQVKDFAGLDRNRPLGVMIFLSEGLPPTPLPVFFLPVTNLDELAGTLGLGPMKPKKVEGTDNRYELVGRRQSVHLVQVGTYAYLSPNSEILEANLPAPDTLVESLADRYDISAAVRLQTIPQGVRDVFLAFLRANTEAELQRRDDEQTGAYEARRAAGISNLEFIEQILTQCDQLTIGWDASQEKGVGALEVHFDAAPGSELAENFRTMAVKPSRFNALFREDQPLTFSASWVMNKREQTAAVGMLKAFSAQMRQEFDKADGDPFPAVDRIVTSLGKTVAYGHADFSVQFAVPEPGRFVLYGGLGLEDADQFAIGLRELAQDLQAAGKLEALELNIAEHEGVVFHRFVFKNVGEREQRLYGGIPSLYVGAGMGALWFAVGNDQTMPHLTAAMDQVTASRSGVPKRTTPMPFQAVIRVSPWLQLPPEEDDSAVQRREFAGKAFTKDSDALRIDVRPTENGVRFRLQMDEGFIRLLGLGVARQIDQFTGAETIP